MTGRSLRLTLMSVVALGALTACSPSASDGGATDGAAPLTNTGLATAMASGAITSTDMVSVTAVIPDITAAPPTIATLEPLSGKLQEVEPGGPMVAVELLEAFTPMPARPEGTGPVDKDKQPPLEDFFVRSADVEAGIRAGMDIVWLDARDKLNYDFSHIPGAINAPFFEVAEHVSEIPRDKWVVSYCECPHHESGEAAMGLWSEGYRYVKVLEEGFAGWRDGLGMPVEASPKTPSLELRPPPPPFFFFSPPPPVLLVAGCARQDTVPNDALPAGEHRTAEPGARRFATPEVPRYEGCYVAFDSAFDITRVPVDAAASAGTLTLQFAADPRSMGDFTALDLALLDCAGANRGAVRDVGWARIPALRESASLPVRTGAPVTVAEGPLAAGTWDRVFAAAPTAWGVAADGRRTALEAHVEPIARGFVMPAGGRVTVVMELTTRGRPERWNGGWNLFTKDAWLVADDPLGP